MIIVNEDTILILTSKDNLIYNEYISNMYSYIFYPDNTINTKTTLVMQLLENFLGNMKPMLGTSNRKMKQLQEYDPQFSLDWTTLTTTMAQVFCIWL